MAEPVTFPFRPDWSEQVVEKLSFLTEILGSIVGAEQAIATRYAMRRSVEARFLVQGNERSFLTLMLERRGSDLFRVPLWFHRAKLQASTEAGATTLPCDTLHREFRAGDYALLVGPDAFTCETVELATVSDTGLTLADGLTRSWSAGSAIHPLRTARLESTPMEQATDRVAETRVRFTIEAGEDVAADPLGWTDYLGHPIMALRPDWSEALEVTLARLQDEHDSEIGLSILADTAGRAFRTVRHGYMLDGRAQQAAFRNLLRRLRGRQGLVWMPTLARDVLLAAPSAAGAQALEIERIGLSQTGGISDEFAHLLFSDGTALGLTDLEVPANPANERVTLAAAAPRTFATGERASFLQMARLDQDTITISHETDSDGVATTHLAWASIDGSRDGSASGAYPIPPSIMTAGGCCDTEGSQATIQIQKGEAVENVLWSHEARQASSGYSGPAPLRLYRSPFPGQGAVAENFPELSGYFTGNWYHWSQPQDAASPLPNYPYPNADGVQVLNGLVLDSQGNWSGGFDPAQFLAKFPAKSGQTEWAPGVPRSTTFGGVRFSSGSIAVDNAAPTAPGTYSATGSDYTDWYYPTFGADTGEAEGDIAVAGGFTLPIQVFTTDPYGNTIELTAATETQPVRILLEWGEIYFFRTGPAEFHWVYENGYMPDAVTTQVFALSVTDATGATFGPSPASTITITLLPA